MKEEKNTKNKSVDDDGRTIADMNIEGFRWFTGRKSKPHKSELYGLNITKAERRAMVKGALLAVLPILLASIGIFAAVFILTYVWLS
ncbi:MAG TPA: hypothetical protein DD733_01875 [Clostridiales bacterium]|nr:hypothetical protein [Eubacteriales bacterium]HBR30810.1 hypothetical protein [Clostridiales bacterium]